MILSQKHRQTVRKQLIKADDFLQSAYSQIESVNKNVPFCYFFPPSRVLVLCRGKSGLIFFQTLFLSVSLALSLPYLIPPSRYAEWVPVCGLCPSKLCLGVYLLLENKSLAERQTNGRVCTLLPGVSPSYRQPNHKQT